MGLEMFIPWWLLQYLIIGLFIMLFDEAGLFLWFIFFVIATIIIF